MWQNKKDFGIFQPRYISCPWNLSSTGQQGKGVICTHGHSGTQICPLQMSSGLGQARVCIKSSGLLVSTISASRDLSVAGRCDIETFVCLEDRRARGGPW